jgi:hypothetical protein
MADNILFTVDYAFEEPEVAMNYLEEISIDQEVK